MLVGHKALLAGDRDTHVRGRAAGSRQEGGAAGPRHWASPQGCGRYCTLVRKIMVDPMGSPDPR
jgi:hypothetical protein